MDEVCVDFGARARKNESSILRQLASVGQITVARLLGLSETTVSRWKSEPVGKDNKDVEIRRIAKILAALDLKAVPIDYKCYDTRTLDAMLTLAQQRMNQIKGIDNLAFEDDE